MNQIILLLLLSLSDYVPTNVESFVEARGVKQKVDSQDVLMVQIPKNIWEDINKGRKLVGRAVIDYDMAHKEPFYNREYVTDWVNLTKHELAEALKKDPTEDQIFVAWMIGMKSFRKLDYDPAKIKDEILLLKLEIFRMTQKNRVRSEVHEPPPPLPSDGRPLVPRRYQGDWDRPEEVRARYK